MLDISKIRLKLEQVIPPEHKLLLLHSKVWRKYEDGKATDEVLGTQYEVVVNGGDFDKFWVKVEDAGIGITEDEIQSSKEKMIVTFKDAVCTLYTDARNQIQISVKAKAIDVQ